jgi:hypothetical protein
LNVPGNGSGQSDVTRLFGLGQSLTDVQPGF